MAATDRKSAVERLATRDGTGLAYTLYGPPKSGRRIALIHSLAMDRGFWRPVAERLARDASVLVYDCRGHGASDKPAGPYSVRQFADDLADLMTRIGWDSAVIGGASMGGTVALAFAIAYPARVKALGLIDTTSWYGAEAPQQWAERAERARTQGLGSMVEFQTTRWFGDAFRAKRADVVAESVATFLANDVAAYGACCTMLGAADLRAETKKLGMPATVIVGEEDYATPGAMSEALHRELAASSLIVLPRARHLTPLECPDEIAAALDALIGRTRT